MISENMVEETGVQFIAMMDSSIREQGNAIDISDTRYHHEIYLSDPRKTAPEKLKTVIRHPIKRG